MKGQLWTVGNWSDGSARISNRFTGSDVLLTVQKDGNGFKALLADADQNDDGQKWIFNIAGAEPSIPTTLSTAILTSLASSSTASTITGTQTLNLSTGTGLPSATASQTTEPSGGGGGLKTAGKVGVGVGVGAAVVAAGLVAVLWKRFWPSQTSGQHSDTPRARLDN